MTCGVACRTCNRFVGNSISLLYLCKACVVTDVMLISLCSLFQVERSRAATDMLRLLYSTGMTVAAGWFTVTNFWATTDPTYNGGVLPMILVCVAAGHLAFKLWFEVRESV